MESKEELLELIRFLKDYVDMDLFSAVSNSVREKNHDSFYEVGEADQDEFKFNMIEHIWNEK